MPVDWVTVPEEPLLGHLEAAVRSGAGAMLVGPAGVGKTSLARAAAADLAADFTRVISVTASAAVCARCACAETSCARVATRPEIATTM